jgi:hypothetical protein
MHAARVGEMRNVYEMLVRIPDRKREVGRTSRRLRVIFKWILNKLCVRLWDELNRTKYAPFVVACKEP